MQLHVLKLVVDLNDMLKEDGYVPSEQVCGLTGIQQPWRHLMVRTSNMGERNFAARFSFTSDLQMNLRFLNAGFYIVLLE